MSMSNLFKPLWGVLEPKLVILTGKWAIGSTGAVGTKTGGGGLALTRNNVGNYTIQLKGAKEVTARCNAILHASVNAIDTDVDPTNDAAAHYVRVLSMTDSTGAILFQCFDEAGAAAELPSGATISCSVFAKLSSVTR